MTYNEYEKKICNIKKSKLTRLDLISFIIKTTNAKSYLEIGCKYNFVFDNIDVENKVGVDPWQGGNCRMTSDEFFASNTQKFDIIFIDGDHNCYQAKKDVYNSLRCLNTNGVIIMHDMLPESEASTVVSNHGDVWKVNFDLIKEKNLLYKIVEIDWGCGVILPGTQNTKKIKMKRKTVQNWNDYVEYFHKLPIVSYEEFTELLTTMEK